MVLVIRQVGYSQLCFYRVCFSINRYDFIRTSVSGLHCRSTTFQVVAFCFTLYASHRFVSSQDICVYALYRNGAYFFRFSYRVIYEFSSRVVANYRVLYVYRTCNGYPNSLRVLYYLVSNASTREGLISFASSTPYYIRYVHHTILVMYYRGGCQL